MGIGVKLEQYLTDKKVFSLFHPILLANKADFARYVEFEIKDEKEEKSTTLNKIRSFGFGGKREKNKTTERVTKWVVLDDGRIYIFNKCYNVLPDDEFSVYDIEELDDNEILERNGNPEKEIVFKTWSTGKPAK